MAIYSTASEAKTFERLGNGTYRMKLTSMEVKKQMNQFKGREVERIMWRFDTTDKAREDGESYAVFHWTGLDYGPEKAGLTHLINQMYGRPFTADEYGTFDLQQLEGQEFMVTVVKEITQDGDRNKIVGIEAPGTLPMPPGVGKSVDPEEEKPGPRLTEAQKKKMAARLKLTDEEAAQMDAWGNMPDEEDYAGADLGDPFSDQ